MSDENKNAADTSGAVEVTQEELDDVAGGSDDSQGFVQIDPAPPSAVQYP